ncbi:hypothetical protein TcBrA4_0049390 [Trypanosoma cruzi]|nr:hypothetical protein TcBrA4_0049390 [Trypanosoma cruzi]
MCGRSSGHKSGAGPRRGIRSGTTRGRRGNGLELRSAGCHCEGGQRASVRSAGRSAMMKPCGFLAGCCGWRTMEALNAKAPPRVSHRSTYWRLRTGTASGRGLAALPPNTASSTLLPLGFTQLFCSPATFRDPACSGTSEGVQTPCADAVASPPPAAALCTPASVCLS